MKAWLTENWDKVLGFLTTMVIAGIVGFFTAIRATEGQIAELKTKIVALETDSANLYKPKIVAIDSATLEIERIRSRLDQLDRESDIQKSTYNLLNLAREEEKRRTVNDLKEMLKGR